MQRVFLSTCSVVIRDSALLSTTAVLHRGAAATHKLQFASLSGAIESTSCVFAPAQCAATMSTSMLARSAGVSFSKQPLAQLSACWPVRRSYGTRTTRMQAHSSSHGSLDAPSPSSSTGAALSSATHNAPATHAPDFLARGLLQQCALPNGSGTTTLVLAAALGLALLAGPGAHAASASDMLQHQQQGLAPMYELAEEQEFWGNVARYGRFFVTVMLGTGSVLLRPLVEMFKRPVSAIFAIVGIVGLCVFVKYTLDAMLGLSEPFDYTPGSMF